MNVIFRMSVEEQDGVHDYSVRLLQRFGAIDPYLTPQKIQELWIEFSQHDSLFSDFTRGKVEPFLDVLFDPRAIVAELYDETADHPSGVFLLNKVIPGYDAQAHMTQWDSNVKRKDLLFLEMMGLWMEEFNLHRMSAEVPWHQKGVIRMIERLGFHHEGTRREGTISRGKWIDLAMFGILKSELDTKLKEDR